MRVVGLLVTLGAATAAAQIEDRADFVSKPGCCNRRPWEHADTLDGMPKVPGATGKPLRLDSDVAGWRLVGDPRSYELSCDTVTTSCTIPILRSRPGAPADGVATLAHDEAAPAWRGKRLVVRAELRAGRVTGWAGLWVRALGADGHLVAARTMQSQALRGTTSFAAVELSLLVPERAEVVSFGVELHGEGALYVRTLEVHEDAAR